jgi:hypothetical protein
MNFLLGLIAGFTLGVIACGLFWLRRYNNKRWAAHDRWYHQGGVVHFTLRDKLACGPACNHRLVENTESER